MANSDLKYKKFKVDNSAVSDYLNGAKEVSYTNATTIKNRLEGNEGLDEKEKTVLGWFNKLLKRETDKIYRGKDIQTKAGKKNAHKKKHTKDGADNKNVTKIGGLVDVRMGPRTGASHQVYNGKMAYHESIESEIEAMKYLIEYMDNNKKIIN